MFGDARDDPHNIHRSCLGIGPSIYCYVRLELSHFAAPNDGDLPISIWHDFIRN